MRIKRLMAVVGLSLFGLLGSAWSAEPVGAALCVTCHDEEDLPDMSRSAHAQGAKAPPMAAAAAALASRPMGDAGNPSAPTCSSCHGASDAHAYNRRPAGVSERPHPDRMFTKKSTTPASERSAVCLACHSKDAKRALWGGSQHDAADPCRVDVFNYAWESLVGSYPGGKYRRAHPYQRDAEGERDEQQGRPQD